MAASRGLRRKSDTPFACWILVEDRGYNTPCHIWHGRVGNHGYGLQGAKLAHRLSYASHFGGIPEGLSVDHLCRVRRCVNPAHLEAVTLAENTRRQLAAAPNPKGPRCGHQIEPHWKNCRICRRADRARYRNRLRAAFGTGYVRGGFSSHAAGVE